MSAEEFIKDCTKRCSNESDWSCRTNHSEIHYFQPWLTPDQARKAVEIEREEVRQEILKNTIECEVVGIKKSILADRSGFVEVKGDYKEGDKLRIYVFKED